MRNYVPCWDKIGISKERYLELLYFCRQYRRWKHEAAQLLGIQSHAGDGQPHGSGITDPTARAAEKRAALTEKIALVERCAQSVGSGEWTVSLISNICDGKPYAYIDPVELPTANRSAFFKARREFFVRLNGMKDAKEGEADGIST